MPKRGNRDGSVTRVGDHWRAQIMLGYDANGARIRFSATGSTKKAASDKLNAKIKLYETEKNAKVEDNYTVGAFLETWLKTYKMHSVAPRTYESYCDLATRYLHPAFGNRNLASLTALDVQALVNDMNSRGLSRRTIEYTVAVLKCALTQAVKNDLVAKNVATQAVLPKKQKKDIRIMTTAEELRFLTTCKANCELPFILMLATGIRRSECIGLMWADVDFAENRIYIRRSLQRVKTLEGGEVSTALVFGEVKTSGSRRTIPVPVDVMLMLAEEKKLQTAQQAKMKKMGIPYSNLDLIFATSFGGPLDPGNLTRRFHKLLKASAVPQMGLHSLRHTYASRMLEAGIHPKIVQEILGHASIQMTLDTYTHVLPDVKQAAANAIAPLFSEIGGKMNEE